MKNTKSTDSTSNTKTPHRVLCHTNSYSTWVSTAESVRWQLEKFTSFCHYTWNLQKAASRKAWGLTAVYLRVCKSTSTSNWPMLTEHIAIVTVPCYSTYTYCYCPVLTEHIPTVIVPYYSTYTSCYCPVFTELMPTVISISGHMDTSPDARSLLATKALKKYVATLPNTSTCKVSLFLWKRTSC